MTAIEDSPEGPDCPADSHGPMAKILYGMIAPDADLFDQVNRGEVVLSGCLITEDDPTHECTECGLRRWPDGRVAPGPEADDGSDAGPRPPRNGQLVVGRPDDDDPGSLDRFFHGFAKRILE